jgi:hypothetical protein
MVYSCNMWSMLVKETGFFFYGWYVVRPRDTVRNNLVLVQSYAVLHGSSLARTA